MGDYSEAPDVRYLAAELVNEIPQHQQLLGVRIEILFSEKGLKHRGRACYARISIIRGKYARLAARRVGDYRRLRMEDSLRVILETVRERIHGSADVFQRLALVAEEGLSQQKVDADWVDDDDFYLIEIDRTMWESLSARQRIAVLDHELCHCLVEEDEDGNRTLGLVLEDLMEFRSVVERHGTEILPDVAEFFKSCRRAEENAIRGQLTLPVDEGLALTTAELEQRRDASQRRRDERRADVESVLGRAAEDGTLEEEDDEPESATG